MGLLAILTGLAGRVLKALAVAAVALVLTSPGARAESSAVADDATAFIRGFADQGTALLADTDLEPEVRAQAFRRLFRDRFAIDAISRFVVGKHWRSASAAERSEFRDLFEHHIVTTYTRHMDDYAGVSLKLGPARVDTARLGKARRATVSSLILRPRGAPVSVDWRLHRADGSWRIVDVVIEGVSLAIAQRAEFASVIRGNGVGLAGLLAKLRQATADDRARGATKIASSHPSPKTN
jgi:phospholipid transport system substrate-binding protein